jgi:hypothetical protein
MRPIGSGRVRERPSYGLPNLNGHRRTVGLALAKLKKILRNLPVRRTYVIERRRLQRTRVAQPAKVLAEDADVGHDCTVENLNTLGACISLDVAAVAELPRKFDLTFDNCHTYWHCDVIWRDGDLGRVGVSWKTR